VLTLVLPPVVVLELPADEPDGAVPVVGNFNTSATSLRAEDGSTTRRSSRPTASTV
jgi:hypothetical protein